MQWFWPGIKSIQWSIGFQNNIEEDVRWYHIFQWWKLFQFCSVAQKGFIWFMAVGIFIISIWNISIYFQFTYIFLIQNVVYSHKNSVDLKG